MIVCHYHVWEVTYWPGDVVPVTTGNNGPAPQFTLRTQCSGVSPPIVPAWSVPIGHTAVMRVCDWLLSFCRLCFMMQYYEGGGTINVWTKRISWDPTTTLLTFAPIWLFCELTCIRLPSFSILNYSGEERVEHQLLTKFNLCSYKLPLRPS